MSKQVSAKELAEIVKRLLTDTETTGELDSFESFQGFMTDIAQVVCDYCGGETRHPADSLDDTWYVGIHGNDSLPDALGGIWLEYDKEGELFDEGTPECSETMRGQEHSEKPTADQQSKLQMFMNLLEKANAVTIDNGPVLINWSTSSIEGVRDNCLVRFSWVDEDFTFATVLDEGGISDGNFSDDGVFVCEDNEGDTTEIRMFALAQINQLSQ